MPPRPAGLRLRRPPYSIVVQPGEQAVVTAGSLEDRNAAELYERLAWLYAGVFATSMAIARVPLRVMLRTSDGTEPAPVDHPLQRLLDYPDPSWSAFKVKEHFSAFLDLTGTAYALLDGGQAERGGPPRFLVPLPSQDVRPVRGREQLIEAFDYRSKVRWPAHRVLHVEMFSPLDAALGQGSVRAARMAALVDLYAQAFNKEFFRNGATLSGVLEFDDELDPDVLRRLVDKFVADHAGASRAWKVRGVSHGGRFKPFQPTHTDMLFGELRRMNREEILACLGVPPVLVGVLDGATYANANQQKREFYENTVVPRLEMIVSAINLQLARRYGEGVTVAYDLSGVEALQTNRKDLASVAQIMFDRGALTPNEFREAMVTGRLPDLAPLPAELGDVTFVPLNLIPADMARDGSAAGDAGAGTEGAAMDNAGEDFGEEVDRILAEAQRATADLALRRAGAGAELVRLSRWRAFDRKLRQHERATRVLAARMFRAQERQVLEVLGKLEERGVPPGVVLRTELEDVVGALEKGSARWANVFSGRFRETVKDGGTTGLRDAGVDGEFSFASPATVEFAQRQGAELVTGVNQRTKRQLARELAAGIEEGETLSQLKSRVRHVFRVAHSRAMTIARTESIKAYNFGTVEGYKQSGVVEQKEWLSSRDADVRDEHADADGQRVAVGDSFEVGGYALSYPGDPSGPAELVVNCRCTTIPVVREAQEDSGHAPARRNGAGRSDA